MRNGYCPVFCRNNQKSLGNKKLIELGVIAIDENWDGKLDVPSDEEKGFKRGSIITVWIEVLGDSGVFDHHLRFD